MADIDIDLFREHESRTDDHTDTDENIPLDLVTPGGSTWKPTREHSEEESLKEPN